MQTETWYFVTREVAWRTHAGERSKKEYLVGVRYPIIDSGPYCGPNPEEVTWADEPGAASRWGTEEHAAIVARCTRDTLAKVERRTVHVETITA